LPPIDIGDSLPSLVLKNEKGEDVQVSDLATENGVVLFLVPKADTGGFQLVVVHPFGHLQRQIYFPLQLDVRRRRAGFETYIPTLPPPIMLSFA